jgi:hypothetical protein
VPEIPAVGSTFEVPVVLASTGAVRAIHVPLAWNPAAVEPVSSRSGELLSRQGLTALAFEPAPGVVDAAGFGGDLFGEGELAVVTFRVIGAGDPGIGLGEVIARDGANRPVPVEGAVSTDRGTGVTPTVTGLIAAFPNPFRAGTAIAYALAEPGHVTIEVFSVDGRRVRTLLDETRPSGEHRVAWDGRTESGQMAAAGTYLLRFRTPQGTQTDRIVRLK